MKWIVVVDRTKARFFKEKPFSLMSTLTNELGREKNRAMTTDKPGSSGASFSGSPAMHTMSGEKDPHEQAAIQFARKLGHDLKHDSDAHLFDHLKIVVEPKMMGHLREFLEPHLKDRVEWMPKDYAHLSDHEVGLALGFNMRTVNA